MSGEWIKMRLDLASDPAVIRIRRSVGLDVDAVVGKLHRLWSWADAHTIDGTAEGLDLEWVDETAGVPGFGAAMLAAGWLEETERGVRFANFDRHNGQSAKVRALAQSRMKRIRCADSATEAQPEEEKKKKKKKRREETHTPYGRVCSGDTPAKAEGFDAHGTWETFRQAWNATPNTKPYNALGCPSEALGLVLEPAFTDGYTAALERLGQSTFFTDPCSVTWFIRNWSRVLAGEFDGRIQRRGKPKAKAFQLEERAT